MNLIDDVSESLSSKKNRRILLLLAILFIELLSVSLYYDLKNFDFDAGNERLSTMLDVIQSIFIVLTLFYIFIHTNKEESLRYENNPFFYLKKYPDEIDRFLAIKKTDLAPLFSTLRDENLNTLNNAGAAKSKFVSKGELKTRLQSYLLSNSVLEYVPEKKTLISDLEFLKLDSNYDLPWFIANLGNDLLVKKFNISEKFDYNGTTLSLNKFKQAPNGKLTFEFSKSFYYNYLVTNMMPEVKVMQNVTVRDLLEPNKKLNRIEDSLAENHLGLSALIVTKDNYLIIPRRTFNTTVFKGQLSPSVSGAASIITCTGEDGEISAKNWLMKELKEELSDILTGNDINLNFNVDDAEFIGMSREMKRLGKPEIFFFCRLANIVKDDLIKNKLVHQLFTDNNALGKPLNQSFESIDEHENEKYFIADIDTFIKNFEVASEVKKYRNQEGKENYSVTVTEPTASHVTLKAKFMNSLTGRARHKKMTLSESLLVNCIFYLKHIELQQKQK